MFFFFYNYKKKKNILLYIYIIYEYNNVNEGGNNQKLILYIRGKAISGAPIIRGTSQFPNPPIIIGITIKKIITKA